MRRGLPVAAAAFHAGMGFCRCFSRWGGVFCRSSPLPPVPGRHSGCLLPGCLLLRLGLLSVSLLPHSGILSYPCSSPAPSFARLFRAPGRPCRSRIAASRCVPPPSAPGTSPGMPRHKPARRACVLPCFAVSCLPPLPRRRAGCRVLLGGVVGITSNFYRKTTIFCCFSNFYLYICIAETKRHGIWIFTLRPTNSQPFKIKSSPGSLAA